MTVRAGAQMLVPRMARRMSPRDPSDIDGLTVWLESDRGVVLDSSGNVSEWRDLSGRGNHAVQATAGARPTYAIDANGRRVVRTSSVAIGGTLRFLSIPQTTDTDPHATLGFSVYAAIHSTSTAGFAYVITKYPSVAATNNWILAANLTANSTAKFAVSETGTNTDRIAAGGDASTGAAVCLVGWHDPTGFVRVDVSGVAGSPTAIAGVKATSAVTEIGCFGGVTAAAYDGDILGIAIFRRYLPIGGADGVFIRDYFRRMCGTP